MKVVFIGDIVGGSGRRTIAAVLPTIREEHAPDLVIANVENVAGGFGPPVHARETFPESSRTAISYLVT